MGDIVRYEAVYDRIRDMGHEGYKHSLSPSKERKVCRKALKFARTTHIPLRYTPDWVFQWDGKQIATHKQEHSSILHDIAHWCVASPKRRSIPEFGLGPGPDSRYSGERNPKAPEKLSPGRRQREEERASILGILIELHLGMFPANTFDYHSWNFDDDFSRTLNWLIKRGFIDAKGNILKIGAWSADR